MFLPMSDFKEIREKHSNFIVENKISLSKNKLNILVAFTEKNKFISNGEKMPWKRLSVYFAFMKYIMNIDKDAVVILGRKTLEIAKYTNYNKIVLSRTEHEDTEKIKYVKSFAEALELVKGKTIIIAGGQQIYREALNYPYRLFFTLIEEKEDMHGDRIFPIDYKDILHKKDITENYLKVCDISTDKYSVEDDSIIENGHKFKLYVIEN